MQGSDSNRDHGDSDDASDHERSARRRRGRGHDNDDNDNDNDEKEGTQEKYQQHWKQQVQRQAKQLVD